MPAGTFYVDCGSPTTVRKDSFIYMRTYTLSLTCTFSQ